MVWDNLPSHGIVVAIKLVAAAGAALLPLYSLDLNPIELSFRN